MASIETEDQLFSFANQLLNATVLPKVFQAILDLEVLEIIARAGDSAQLTASEIVAHIPTQNPQAKTMLERMLRLLATYSVLTCSVFTNDNGLPEWRYGLAPVCKYFVRDQVDGVSLAPLFTMSQDKLLSNAWNYLKDVLIEGGVPFERANGMTVLEYLGTNERCCELFSDAALGHTTILIKGILEKYKGFEDREVVVDLGGGDGTIIKSIISKYPHIKGVNFDLPHVIASAPSIPGVENVAGDMFESIPEGDAIFMKNVLHDWSKGQCLTIMKNCWKALPDHGKVIAVEMIVPSAPATDEAARRVHELDMIMMMQQGGERTIEEFKDLARGAGFVGLKPICYTMTFWVIEFYKAN